MELLDLLKNVDSHLYSLRSVTAVTDRFYTDIGWRLNKAT